MSDTNVGICSCGGVCPIIALGVWSMALVLWLPPEYYYYFIIFYCVVNIHRSVWVF